MALSANDQVRIQGGQAGAAAPLQTLEVGSFYCTLYFALALMGVHREVASSLSIDQVHDNYRDRGNRRMPQ